MRLSGPACASGQEVRVEGRGLVNVAMERSGEILGWTLLAVASQGGVRAASALGASRWNLEEG